MHTMKRRVGKPSPAVLTRLLSGGTGRPSSSLRLGPGAGLDAAILDLGGGRVMAVAEDPIFPAPGLPLAMMGEFTVHIGASDVAVTGIRPRYMTYTLLLPSATPVSDARTIIRSISRAADRLGISIVGGHTGWYDAVNLPIVGGVTAWGFGRSDRWISPGGARHDDVLLMTKGPAIEAAALLGVVHRPRLAGRLSPTMLRRLRARVQEITVVQDALTAYRAGGVHAMHDATEGGVLGGVWEMQHAAKLPVEIDLDQVPVPPDIAAIARELGFDPWAVISEGTLLAAVEPAAVGRVQRALSRAGIPSFVLGRFDRTLRRSRVRRAGRTTTLRAPTVDPFWDLFFAGQPASQNDP